MSVKEFIGAFIVALGVNALVHARAIARLRGMPAWGKVAGYILAILMIFTGLAMIRMF